MSSGAFHSMLGTAAGIAQGLAPEGAPTTDHVWIARRAPLALAGPAALETLGISGAGGRRAALTWALRPLLCGRTALRLPADAAAIGNPAKRTVALLSRSAGLVVKLSRGSEAARMLAAEIAAVSAPALRDNGLAPAPLASQVAEAEAWLVAEFCGLAKFPNEEKYVSEIREDLIPRVLAAWTAQPIERDGAGALVDRQRQGAGLIPQLKPAVARLEDLLALSGDFAFPRVATHGDLQPRHMMRASDGRLRLIDWDVAARRVWTADLLRLAWPDRLHGPAWKEGEALLAPAFRGPFEDGLGWARSQGFPAPNAAGRALIVLGALVERTIEIATTRGIPFDRQPRAAPALRAMGLFS